MVLCFGGEWNDSLDDDYDICLGISSDMRESMENYYEEGKKHSMIIKANEAYKNCEKEIKKIHRAVNKCIEDLIMPVILEKSADNMLGYNFYICEFTPYYKIANRNFNYEHPSGIAFCQRLIQKLEEYGYIVEQNNSIIRVCWYKYQEN